MRAVRLESWKSEPVLAEVPTPVPGPGEVLVQVGAAGACHSDLHLMHDFEPGDAALGPAVHPGPRERRLGAHARRRRVRGLGARPAGRRRGRLGMRLAAPGACAGLETYCEDPASAPVPGGGGGLGLDGGMAEFLLVPAARHLVPLPDGLDPVAAAPLTDAGLTPYHAVRRSLGKLAPDSTAW